MNTKIRMGKSGVIRTDYKKIFELLILFTPVIDTINGLLLRSNIYISVISIGMIFRLLFMGFILRVFIKKGVKKEVSVCLFSLVYFIVVALIWGINDGIGALFSYITYAAKWMLPIMIVCCFLILYKDIQRDEKERIKKILDFFSYIFAIFLIVEFLFGIGTKTYYDAGFKGLFYSTNDISYCLTISAIITLFDWFQKNQIKKFVKLIINLAALIILSAKSGFVFIAFSLICFIFYFIRNKKFVKKILLFFSAICGVIFLYINMFNNEIDGFFGRYMNMYAYTIEANGFNIDAVLNFLTSGRWLRTVYQLTNFVNMDNFVLPFLFGWIAPDNGTYSIVVEMDFFDAFFQYGSIGMLLLIFIYIYFFSIRKKDFFWTFVFFISMMSAMWGGHIISGALSGTYFALCCSAMILGIKVNER